MGIQNIFNKFAGKPKTAELVNTLPWSYRVRRNECITNPFKTGSCAAVHKDSRTQQSYGFLDNNPDSFSASRVNSASAYFNEAVKRLDGIGRGPALYNQRLPESDFEIEAGYLVEQERKAAFQNCGKHFDSSYYSYLN